MQLRCYTPLYLKANLTIVYLHKADFRFLTIECNQWCKIWRKHTSIHQVFLNKALLRQPLAFGFLPVMHCPKVMSFLHLFTNVCCIILNLRFRFFETFCPMTVWIMWKVYVIQQALFNSLYKQYLFRLPSFSVTSFPYDFFNL